MYFTGFEMQTLNSENVMNDKMSIYDCAPPSENCTAFKDNFVQNSFVRGVGNRKHTIS